MSDHDLILDENLMVLPIFMKEIVATNKIGSIFGHDLIENFSFIRSVFTQRLFRENESSLVTVATFDLVDNPKFHPATGDSSRYGGVLLT